MTKTIEAVEQFLDAAFANGLKPATLRWYAGKLKPFAVEFGQKQIEDLTVNHMRAYVRALRERSYRLVGDADNKRREPGGLSIDSLRGHVKMLKAFFGWVYREYNLPAKDNPMAGIKAPAKPQPAPKAISPEDARRMLDACDEGAVGKRNRALFAFLLDTGCRATGALTLNLDEVDLVNRRAQVFEKFDKARLVGFSDITAGWLREWIDIRPKDAVAVFCSLSNISFGQPITMAGLNDILRVAARRAGVKGRYNAHAFRHGFARRYIQAGGDVSTLAKLMGHTSTTITTEMYAVFMVEEALAKYQSLDLMSKLLKR